MIRKFTRKDVETLLKNMRKLSAMFLIAAMLVTSMAVTACGTNPIEVHIDGTRVSMDNQTGTLFVDGNMRTQVPFRAALEAFGAGVAWDGMNNTAIAVKGDIVLKIPVGQNYFTQNGTTIRMDTAAQVKDGRTYLPIRPVLEALGATVEWNADQKVISVTSGEPGSSVCQYTYGTTTINGNAYQGILKDGVPDIYGEYTFSQGKYAGEIVDQQRSGKGTFTFQNGDRYAGSWRGDEYNGQGTYTFGDGSSYRGTWTNGVLNGTVTYKTAGNVSYQCEFSNGVPVSIVGM